MLRRLEDKIRNLCTQIIATENDTELTPLVTELREALHQHMKDLRVQLSKFPLVINRRTRDVGGPSS